MEPFFFGNSSKQLLGIYHPPKHSVSTFSGIILCHAWGQEYIRSYRAMLILAEHLCRKGFHVLRFDYTGCGDSSGDCFDVTIEDCISDISMAANQLRDGCHIRKIGFVGLRLGAYLVTQYAKRSDIWSSPLVLWQTVTNGAHYLADLTQQHADSLSGTFAERVLNSSAYLEMLGFPVSRALFDSLSGINYESLCPPKDSKVLIVNERPCHDILLLRDLISHNCAITDLLTTKTGTFWRKSNARRLSSVPIRDIEEIVQWLTQNMR
jgi:pimeloyl-ACP methyl ester carboxylesterase